MNYFSQNLVFTSHFLSCRLHSLFCGEFSFTEVRKPSPINVIILSHGSEVFHLVT